MAKKVVLEVEGFAKVLSFVSDQKLSTPGVLEVYKILLEATSMDIILVENMPSSKPPLGEEVPPPEQFTEEDFDKVLKGE